MNSTYATIVSSHQPKVQHLSLRTVSICIPICALIFLFFFSSTFLYNQSYNHYSDLFEHKRRASPHAVTDSPTNVGHIMFVLVGSKRTWKYRRPYVEAWWRKNITRGNIWLDIAPTEELLPWPSSSPPFRVNEDITKLRVYPKVVNPIQIRIFRSILETFRLGDNKDVRWYVMADDDSLFFIDNLVEVLGKYDHTKYYYIGTNSECIRSNYDFSFDMGFGGAGFALSYTLVEALVSKVDDCIERYPHSYVSDYLSHSCLADVGADLTIEKGIHQIDLQGDISGLLSAHPKSPIVTLHHFDTVEPIFPSKNRSESINHIMTAANVDQSRLMQQSICYHRQSNWTFSISWGYSAHIYENIFPRSILRKPLETFRPWKSGNPPFYMFNTRWLTDNPCEAPHVLFLETIRRSERDQVLTIYTRSSARNLPPCSSTGNHSADPISKIQVFSPAIDRKKEGRIECCDVEYEAGKDTAKVNIRTCMKGEILA